MKNLLKSTLVFLLILNSCSKDTNDEITPEESSATPVALVENLRSHARTAATTNQQSNMFNSDIDCFELNFPYSITDGTNTAEINSDDDILEFIQTLDEGDILTLVFPITITLEDNTTQTINSEEELAVIAENCYDGEDCGEGVADCFTFNYPLSVLDENGSEVIINSAEEFNSVSVFIEFVFPLDITLQDGTVQTINNASEFDSVYNDCYGIEDCEDCEENCFEIVYPFTLSQNNDTTHTINSDQEFFDFLSGLDENAEIALTYPVNVELEDGSQQAINSDEEFEALLNECNN